MLGAQLPLTSCPFTLLGGSHAFLLSLSVPPRVLAKELVRRPFKPVPLMLDIGHNSAERTSRAGSRNPAEPPRGLSEAHVPLCGLAADGVVKKLT